MKPPQTVYQRFSACTLYLGLLGPMLALITGWHHPDFTANRAWAAMLWATGGVVGGHIIAWAIERWRWRCWNGEA